MKFLIVDDSRAMRKIVARTLRQAGFGEHDCVEAENGADALAKVPAEKPDLILCDWNMPEMNGLELLTQLRGAGHTMKFGFITTEGTPEMRQRATDAGADFLLQKPFTADQMESVLNAHLVG